MSTPEYPDLIEIEEEGDVDLIEIETEGPTGATGNPGIIVSVTEPPGAEQNALWLEIPPEEE